MDLDTFQPTFLIQIEGQAFSADITGEITSFIFEDNEEELDVMELSVTNRNLQFVDDPLFQEGNEIVARFGYVGNLSPRKKAVIKDIDSDLELAKALGAVEHTNDDVAVRVLGLLLFSREDVLASTLPAHEVAFQVLSETEVEVNDFFRWPLLRVMQELEARFRARNREREILVGVTRIGVPDYPERAFREGVANALTHRDYTRLGAVHVQWRKDRLAISNPGGFPDGVRLDNLLVTQPRPRNPLLADAFKRAGIVERTARGIDTIFVEQIRTGRPAPSYDKSTETGIVLELPGDEANLGFVRLVVEQGREGHPFSQDELLLLNALGHERRMTVSDAATTIQRGEGDAETVLRKLSESGIVEMRGTAGRQVFLPAQPVDATQALKRSAGVSNSRVWRGRPLSLRAILFRCSCECTDKSVPLGKYCRSRPLVFSLEPRCQGLLGSQK